MQPVARDRERTHRPDRQAARDRPMVREHDERVRAAEAARTAPARKATAIKDVAKKAPAKKAPAQKAPAKQPAKVQAGVLTFGG